MGYGERLTNLQIIVAGSRSDPADRCVLPLIMPFPLLNTPKSHIKTSGCDDVAPSFNCITNYLVWCVNFLKR
jgi:hypothetical protein